MRLHLAVHFAWPRLWPILTVSFEIRVGSPTTVSPNQEGNL